MLMVNQLNGFGNYPPSAAAAASVTFTDSSVNGSALTTYTFATQALGTAAAGRVIVVGVGGGGQTRTVSSMTIGGTSATFIIRAAGTNETAELWYAVVAAGTTGDVVVTWSGAQDGCGIGVWAVYDATSAPHDSSSDNNSDPATATTFDVPASGVAVGYVFQRTGSSTYTWTNLTERFDEVALAATFFHSGASDAFASLQTSLAVSVDADSAGTRDPMFVCGSWAPA
jgi:hypothetical protein